MRRRRKDRKEEGRGKGVREGRDCKGRGERKGGAKEGGRRGGVGRGRREWGGKGWEEEGRGREIEEEGGGERNTPPDAPSQAPDNSYRAHGSSWNVAQMVIRRRTVPEAFAHT